VRLLAMAVFAILATGAAAAQDAPGLDGSGLDGSGAYDAVNINGFVLQVQDVQRLLNAGILRLNPDTRRFAFGPGITSERALTAQLARLNLNNPRAPRELYRAFKVALPNGAAHELTIPSGFGPAFFANQPGVRTVSASFGGVSRVPYTRSPDAALGLGLSFGNSFNGLGASVMASFNDLSDLGNTDRISWGIVVSHYLTDGLSVAVGGENLFVKTTDGEASFYLAGSWAFDTSDHMPFKGVLTLGAGSGRFAKNTERDLAEGRVANATMLFGGVAWEVSDRLNLITEWNGRNLNVGVGYTLPKSGISLKLGVENLTDYSGDGPILTGSVGVTLARF